MSRPTIFTIHSSRDGETSEPTELARLLLSPKRAASTNWDRGFASRTE